MLLMPSPLLLDESSMPVGSSSVAPESSVPTQTSVLLSEAVEDGSGDGSAGRADAVLPALSVVAELGLVVVRAVVAAGGAGNLVIRPGRLELAAGVLLGVPPDVGRLGERVVGRQASLGQARVAWIVSIVRPLASILVIETGLTSV